MNIIIAIETNRIIFENERKSDISEVIRMLCAKSRLAWKKM